MNRRRDMLQSTGIATVSVASGASISGHQDTTGNIAPLRSAFVFIEFQNEWLDAKGLLNRRMQDRPLFDAAVRNAGTILARARAMDARIVHAGLTLAGDPNYLIFAGGQGRSGLKGAIPCAGTWRDPERVLFPEPFTPRPGEFVVAGRSGASVLANSNLDPYLRNNRIDHLYLMGFALHVCVESTLRHAHDLGYEVTVVEDAAPAFTAQQQAHVIDHVVHHFGTGIKTSELLAGMQQGRAPG